MSDVWRIFVVDGDENANTTIVTALRKEGYFVQGVLNGADAVRVLWSEAFDVIISDLKTPGANGFELLQWVRAYRPNAQTILTGDVPSAQISVRALESGAVSYLEKPLDVRLVKEELRRLLQQTGFSADLDSFDLLDVIQMITMSRRSIALLVNAGLEEHGLLRFQTGELTWAEYGALRGEEAFFALAAHKNGSVVQQPWSGGEVKNVTQPLSRLILQALQYRTKYANPPEYSNEPEPDFFPQSPILDEVDDSPFVTLSDDFNQSAKQALQDQAPFPSLPTPSKATQDAEKPWWESTGTVPRVQQPSENQPSFADSVDLSALAPTVALDRNKLVSGNLRSQLPSVPDTPLNNQNNEPALPSWLTDQPTSANMPALRPPTIQPQVPQTPIFPISAEWQVPPKKVDPTTDQLTHRQAQVEQRQVTHSSPEWQTPVEPLVQPSAFNDTPDALSPVRAESSFWSFEEEEASQPEVTSSEQDLQQSSEQGYNYPAFVSALQTLGYSLPGFAAAAVVGVDGQPIAQVTIDDIDIVQICKPFSSMILGLSQTLELASWGLCQHMVVTSSTQRVVMYIVGEERKAFLLLVTTRDTDPEQCLQMIGNVEGAIEAALK